ncbi:hypothetical protein E2C01_101200 [Portunus trituberculatus]|uniref:Uncharacterized protein n=1 Tax=Portunus trituberculatus TaxID=210409 RepID=A0A5B7KLC8_PORTR|nr:hypothetical protein [Portunus trituberculatus]
MGPWRRRRERVRQEVYCKLSK